MPTTAFAKGIRELAAKDRLKAARVREAITMATGVRRSQYFERQNGNVPLSPRREEGSRPDIPPLPDNRPLGRMKCDADILSRAETRVMQAVINTKGGNITRIAASLHVTYQAVANTLSVMYDKLQGELDGNRTIQALVVWYYRFEIGRRIGAACLLGFVSAPTPSEAESLSERHAGHDAVVGRLNM